MALLTTMSAMCWNDDRRAFRSRFRWLSRTSAQVDMRKATVGCKKDTISSTRSRSEVRCISTLQWTFAQEDVKGYAEIMVIVASADGSLVKEELAIIEALMGRCMMHPEMRVDVRNLLENPPSLELGCLEIEPCGAEDCSYEMQFSLQRLMGNTIQIGKFGIIKTLAKAAGVEEKELSSLCSNG